MPRRKSISSFHHAFVAAGFLAGAHVATAADLTVTIDNVQSDDGQVFVGIFNSSATFRKQVLKGEKTAASQRNANGRLAVRFGGLPAGTYAVSAYHDEDNNGQLNKNLFGIPSEPYGFSAHGSASFGPPDFSGASFRLPDEGAEIHIHLK